MTVTAQSVYRHPVARIFARALQIRLDLSPEIHERVLTAVQETMINAMLHGNLGLGSGLRNDLKGLAASHSVIAARFASEHGARSLIRVQATWTRTRLRVIVRDSGDGFERDERLAAARLGSGRGLMILEALCDQIGIQRRGTVIALNFLLPGVAGISPARGVTGRHPGVTATRDTVCRCGGQLQPVAATRTSHEVVSDWLWETDARSRLTFLSKRFGDISGIPWAQVNGRSISDLAAMGFEQDGMNKIRAATAAHGVLASAVYRVDPARGGTRYWRLSGEPRFDPATGAFAGYRGIGTDVTAAIEHESAMTAALLRAEAAEREALRARRMLEEAIEAIPEGFVLHDAEDRLVLCNTRYREIYGLTAELIKPGVLFEDTLRETGIRSTYVIGDSGLDEWVAERMRRHRTLDGTHIEQRLTDGRWLQIEERRTSDGGTVGIRVDVTEARRREALERDRERTVAELQAARLMQTSLLPSVRLQKEIIASSGLDIASRSASCREIGGDLWGLSALDGGRVGVFTLDVAGHGTTAALTTFRVHTLIHELGAWLLDPGRFLQELNLRLTELLQPGAFATMFYGVVDPAANCISYAAAGSPPPLVRRGTGLPLTPLDSTGVPLGIAVRVEYPCAKVEFGPGGMLFLYSDILTDRIDEHGNRAGEAGAFAWIQRCAGPVSAETAVERVCAPFFDPPGTPLNDDLTVVCIMRP